MYGAWIDTKGNMYPVDYENHWGVGLSILSDKFNLPAHVIEKRMCNRKKYYTVYDLLMRFGFIRVVFDEDQENEFTLDYWANHKLTSKQLSWYENCKAYYHSSINKRFG